MTDKPSLIKVSTLIGYGSPNRAGTHDVHGAALGKDETAATREHLQWNYPPFEIPEEAYKALSHVEQVPAKRSAAATAQPLQGPQRIARQALQAGHHMR